MVRKKIRKVFGWGINDVDYEVTRYETINGKNKIVWCCPYYLDWQSMLRRCFDVKFQNRRPTYKGCTITDNWEYLSQFIKWVDNQPNRDWQNCEPDKDFLITGNKHYSPETVVYIPKNMNVFITDHGAARGHYMIGVTCSYKSSNKNPFMSRCNNPFTNKNDYLGRFPTELEAHLAWKAKKHEHACRLAELRDDPRVAKRLREMYSNVVETD